MYITISYWVVYGVFLFLNLNQVFWGFSLKPYRSRSSALTMASYSFPLAIMLGFGITMGAVLGLLGSTIDLSKNPPTLFLFLTWALATAIIFIILLARKLKK